MRLADLISCAMCLRATRDWRAMELRDSGSAVWSGKVCRACASEVETSVARLVRETRFAAIQRAAR